MKTMNPVRSLTYVTLLAVGLALWPATAADSIEFQRVDKLDKIWLAEGFAFQGYEVLLVTALNAEGIQPKDEKEADRLNLLKRGYAEDMARGLERFAGFPEATSKEADVPAGRKKLVLDTKLLEFSRGSSAARYGLGFGAGMPFIKIRGTFHESDPAKPLAIFEMDEKRRLDGRRVHLKRIIAGEGQFGTRQGSRRFIEKVRNGEKIKYKKVKKD